MPDSTACLNARALLEEIRVLKREFDFAYDHANFLGKEDDVVRARELRRELGEKMRALRETVAMVEAERLFDLRHQYESQTAMLKKAGLLETREVVDDSGVEREALFMTGIDGKEYPMPSYETLVERLTSEERRELLATKADQGFNKLVLVPFGMSLDILILKFREHLIAYKKAHPSFGRIVPLMRDQSDSPEWDPLFVWDDVEGYPGADVQGRLVYDPSAFNTEQHGGKTKTQILVEQANHEDSASGWRVLLLQAGKNGEGLRGIPRSGRGEPQGRKLPHQDLEAGKSPRNYLAHQLEGSLNENSPYHGESGMTPEEWIIAFITNLEETDMTMDDYQNGTDSLAYLTGAYFSASDGVPVAFWYRDHRRVYLDGRGPGGVGECLGVRSVVMG